MTRPITEPSAFGKLVRNRRREAGLLQRQLALAAGVGERFVVDLEAGKPTCQLGKAFAVARTLGIGFSVVSDEGHGGHESDRRGYDLPDLGSGS